MPLLLVLGLGGAGLFGVGTYFAGNALAKLVKWAAIAGAIYLVWRYLLAGKGRR